MNYEKFERELTEYYEFMDTMRRINRRFDEKNKEIMTLEIDEEYLEKYYYSELLENSLITTFTSVKYLLNQKEEE